MHRAVPAGKAPEEALDDNEKYRVVWQILNALRAHDDRLDATINKIELGVDPGDRRSDAAREIAELDVRVNQLDCLMVGSQANLEKTLTVNLWNVSP